MRSSLPQPRPRPEGEPPGPHPSADSSIPAPPSADSSIPAAPPPTRAPVAPSATAQFLPPPPPAALLPAAPFTGSAGSCRASGRDRAAICSRCSTDRTRAASCRGGRSTSMATEPTEKVLSSRQEALVDLVDLALQGKQAHWNLYGPHFRSIHLQLDDIIDEVRLASDDIAERLVTIGGAPDGRAASVAQTSQVEELPAGHLPVDKVIRQFEERLQAAADRMKKNIVAIEEDDPLSQDMLIGVAAGLEKQAWMLRAATE